MSFPKKGIGASNRPTLFTLFIPLSGNVKAIPIRVTNYIPTMITFS
jgi:hypothetical protein